MEQSNTDQAKVDTAGKVRRWLSNSPRPAGTIASTEFSSSNGPRTAGYPFPARDDAGDATARNVNHRWTRVLDPATLATRYGLGTLLSIEMVDGDTRYDGIWHNTVVMVGTARSTPLLVDAWKFRNNNGLPSPGFTVIEQPSAAPTTTTIAPTTTTTVAPLPPGPAVTEGSTTRVFSGAAGASTIRIIGDSTIAAVRWSIRGRV